MDPYAGHMYTGNAHLQNQPQIVTNHYGSLNHPRNRVVYGGNSGSYDNPYNSDPEWQYPSTHHTMKASTDGRYSNQSPYPANYMAGGSGTGHAANGPPNPYLQQHQQPHYPANIHNSPNNYHQVHQNSPNRLPMNIAGTYNGGVVMGNPNHPDVAVNGPNNLTINHTNYLGNHAVSGGGNVPPPPDGQHAVVRQLQEKFGGPGMRGNGEAGSDVTTDDNYGCEPDSALSRNNHIRAHSNHIGNVAGNGGADANHLNNHAQQTHNSSNGGGGGPGLNGVIPALCCASEKDVLDQNGTEEGSENETLCIRSLWVHCRLSVLLVLVVILLILFLSFSGALLYFKSKLTAYFLCSPSCLWVSRVVSLFLCFANKYHAH